MFQEPFWSFLARLTINISWMFISHRPFMESPRRRDLVEKYRIPEHPKSTMQSPHPKCLRTEPNVFPKKDCSDACDLKRISQSTSTSDKNWVIYIQVTSNGKYPLKHSKSYKILHLHVYNNKNIQKKIWKNIQVSESYEFLLNSYK